MRLRGVAKGNEGAGFGTLALFSMFSRFNRICLCLSIFFGLGIFWVVREITSLSDVTIVVRVDTEILAREERAKEKVVLDDMPEHKDLAVPFTSQAPEGNWEQPWQDACEEAAVLMLDAYYSSYSLSPFFSRDEILKMVSWQDEKEWEYSIPMTQVREFANEHVKGQTFHIVENPTVEEIKRSVAHGHPVLVVAYGKDLPNPYFSGDGPVYHALIIKGYTPEHFITNDPGTKHGADFEYTYDDLMNTIHDWNGGDVQHGRRVVLMVQ